MKSITNWKKVAVWVLYIPVAAYVLYLSSQNVGDSSSFFLDYGLFLLLAILVALFPVRTQDSFFSLTSGVSLAALISFGLVPEIFLSSIAILCVLFRSHIKWDQHYRYPINLLASILMSVGSAIAYFASSELLGLTNVDTLAIIPMVVYMVTYTFINQLLAIVLEKIFYESDEVQFFDGNLIFSLRTALMVLPLTFILVYLFSEMGSMGIIVGAFPFLTTSVVTKYYYKSKSNNMLLTEITRYSQMLATKESRKEVIDFFMEYILKAFPSEQVYYFKMRNEKFAVLDRVSNLEKFPKEPHQEMVLMETSPIMKAFKDHKIYVYENAAEWRNNSFYNPDYQPESAIVLPVRLMGINKGLIVITHHQRSIYDEFLVTLIEIFYQYFRVVLDKTYQFEQLEDSNYTDYLTNLPNLKGFSKIFEQIASQKDYETLSLIVLDLDHFKGVNDLHGHEAGNDVLSQVADVLRRFASTNCYVARFGGEEFMVLVKNSSKNQAYQLAEDIRKEIEETIYKVFYSIESETEIEVRVTASLGVSTYPDDAKDIHDLVKLADRAMYLGSKQNGRNKTTMHNQESSRVIYDEAILFKDE